MTDNSQELQHYWVICIPKHKFPEPKFSLGQQVGLSWEDEFGNPFYDIGEIAGMQYVAEGKQPAQWYYRMHLLRCACEPWLDGKYDELFEPESCLVADDTVIEN